LRVLKLQALVVGAVTSDTGLVGGDSRSQAASVLSAAAASAARVERDHRYMRPPRTADRVRTLAVCLVREDACKSVRSRPFVR
jgi:hypothetical protein